MGTNGATLKVYELHVHPVGFLLPGEYEKTRKTPANMELSSMMTAIHVTLSNEIYLQHICISRDSDESLFQLCQDGRCACIG